MDRLIAKQAMLNSMFPGIWVSQAELVAITGFPEVTVDEAVDELIDNGLLWVRFEEGETKLRLYRAASSDDEYLVWAVRRAVKNKFGKKGTPESVCKYLQSRNWRLAGDRTEHHIFKALVAHHKMLTGNDVKIADWPSAAMAILEMGQ